MSKVDKTVIQGHLKDGKEGKGFKGMGKRGKEAKGCFAAGPPLQHKQLQQQQQLLQQYEMHQKQQQLLDDAAAEVRARRERAPGEPTDATPTKWFHQIECARIPGAGATATGACSTVPAGANATATQAEVCFAQEENCAIWADCQYKSRSGWRWLCNSCKNKQLCRAAKQRQEDIEYKREEAAKWAAEQAEKTRAAVTRIQEKRQDATAAARAAQQGEAVAEAEAKAAEAGTTAAGNAANPFGLQQLPTRLSGASDCDKSDWQPSWQPSWQLQQWQEASQWKGIKEYASDGNSWGEWGANP